jgi:hypothetical protein
MISTFDRLQVATPEHVLSADASEPRSYDYLVCGLRFRSNVSFPLVMTPRTLREGPDVEFFLKSEGLETTDLFPARRLMGNIRNGAGRPSITVSEVEQGQLLECQNGAKSAAFFLSRDWRTTSDRRAVGDDVQAQRVKVTSTLWIA